MFRCRNHLGYRIARFRAIVKHQNFRMSEVVNFRGKSMSVNFSPFGAPCAPVLLRNPRPALAAVAAACFPQAPGWASAPGALCRATQTKPGSRGQAKKAPGRHQDRIIQNRNVFCMYPGDSYKILILYVSVSDGKTRAAGASHQLTRPGRKPPSPNGPPGAARPQAPPGARQATAWWGPPQHPGEDEDGTIHF